MKFLVISTLLFSQLAFSLEGLKVGSKVPEINLQTTAGENFNLSKMGKPAVLIFYRGSWCPYCITQLKTVQLEVVAQASGKAQIFAISVDRLKIAKKMKGKNKFSFHVVSDPKAKTLKAFNIINQLDSKLVAKYKSSYKIDVEGDSGEKHHMVAHPAVFIVKDGKVTFSDVHTDYKKRTKNKDILANI